MVGVTGAFVGCCLSLATCRQKSTAQCVLPGGHIEAFALIVPPPPAGRGEFPGLRYSKR